ncbi:MAG: hypothetical protein P4L90_09375 [Rhodopila sp.]|nr:hypothetical protein [Rhodopila sp.]
MADFGASSLETGSFPIEVGWCVQSGQGETHLIRPATTWMVGSAASQTIHGIRRGRLQADAEPVEQLARRVAVAFALERVRPLPSNFKVDRRRLR